MSSVAQAHTPLVDSTQHQPHDRNKLLLSSCLPRRKNLAPVDPFLRQGESCTTSPSQPHNSGQSHLRHLCVISLDRPPPRGQTASTFSKSLSLRSEHSVIFYCESEFYCAIIRGLPKRR